MSELFFKEELDEVIKERDRFLSVLQGLERNAKIIDFRITSLRSIKQSWEVRLKKSKQLLISNPNNSHLNILHDYAYRNVEPLTNKIEVYQNILQNINNKFNELELINQNISKNINNIIQKERYSRLEYYALQQEDSDIDKILQDIHKDVYKAQGYIELNAVPQYLLSDLEKGE